MKSIRFLMLSLVVLGLCVSCNCEKCDSPSGEVKNVIFLIGDGMGLSQVTVSMVENGYKPTVWDRARAVALQKSYSANNRVTDSAAAGTALACGVKTNNGMLGMDSDSVMVESIAAVAAAKGMATGVISTSTVQHATPASFYAHVPYRGDMALISEQLASSELDVVIGVGAKLMMEEVDGVSLLDKMRGRGYEVALTMEDVMKSDADKLVGLVGASHLPSIAKGRDTAMLANATAKAIEVLEKDEDGFFLMVEGSQIDWMGHGNNAKGILEETRDFERAVQVAVDYAERTPGTLVVVTADHETGGMALISGNADFTLADSGVNYAFTTKGHSGTLIPIYLYGTGAERINGIMENTELNKKMREMIE